MAVAAPATGMQIDFDITAARRVGNDLHNGLAEIGTGLVIPESRMKNPDLFPVQGSQLIAQQPLVLPDLLEKAF